MYSSTQLFLIYSGLFFTALVFSLLVNSLFMRFARTLGIRESERMLVRWSSTSKPAFGGIGFYILFLASFTLHGVIFPNQGQNTLRPDLFGLLAATSLGFLMGLADDAYNTRPLLKFLVQLACGVILVTSGTCIDMFSSREANIGLTLLWVVGMMNSINMLDNMDGITTTVSIAILSAGLLALWTIGPIEPVFVVLIIGVMGSLCGFLFFNWHPSRMYMGDTGSQFLGVFLAFVGGRDHTTHHLGYAGFSDGQVALTFMGLSFLHVFLVFVMFRFIPVWGNIHTLIFVLYAVVLFGTFFALTRRTGPDRS
jgi:UDP-GlcNAc:undecaprenyl-phosphate GlcNAc-1-phosphate transferase